MRHLSFTSLLLLNIFLPIYLTINQIHAAEPVRVFLFAGQTNMVGADTNAADVDSFPPYTDALEPLKNVTYSFQIGAEDKSNGWTDLQVVGKQFGPEFTFARTLLDSSNAPIAIIKDAWGGTTLVNDWATDGGNSESRKLYQRFITHVRERLAELDKKRTKYRLEAMMWHQGENDMFDDKGKYEYEQNLRQFIARVRDDLKAPDLKFFIGEISTKGVWGMDNRANVSLIHNAQQKVVNSDPKAYFVPTSHLSFRVGQPVGLHYHFGTLGQLQHGEAYANAYLQSNNANTKENRLVIKNFPKAKKVQLFVLGGQRNMEGEEAWSSELSNNKKFAVLAKPQAALFQYNLSQITISDGWQYLAPVNHLNGFGPELSFAHLLIPQMKNNEILAIYKFTDSGSQALDWLPDGSDELYRDRYQKWISGVKRCRDDLIKKGYQCEIPAVIWHCGENDRALYGNAAEYAERFQDFMNATRKDLSLPNLTWLLTEQPMIPKSISEDEKLYSLNPDLENLAAKDPHLYFVRTSDLPHRPVVFGTEGVVALGKRMAESWIKITKP